MNKTTLSVVIAATISTMSLSAATAADVNEVHVLGAVQSGWNWSQCPNLDKVSDGVYEGQLVLLNGDFKFVADDWKYSIVAPAANPTFALGTPTDVVIGCTDDTDYKWINATPGVYKIKLDLNALTMTVSSADCIYLIGGATPGGWDLGQSIAIQRTGDQTFAGSATIGTGEFKFVASNRNFSSSVVAASEGQAVVLGEAMALSLNPGSVGDNKWNNGQAGAYDFVVDLTAGTLTVTAETGAFIPTAFTITGTALNDTPLCMTDGIYKYCGRIAQGTFAISATDGTTTKWVKLEGDKNITYVASKELATEFNIPEAADYQMVINSIGNTINLDVYTPWENLYIVGSFNGWSFMPFTRTADNEFTWNGDIELGEWNEVKFMGTESWDGYWGLHPYVANTPLTDAEYCYNDGNDNKWIVTATAHYTIVVNTLMQTVKVTTTPAGAVEATAKVAVKAIGGAIVVNAAKDADIAIYNMSGCAVARTYGADVTVDMAAHGVYVVVVDGQVYKVCL